MQIAYQGEIPINKFNCVLIPSDDLNKIKVKKICDFHSIPLIEYDRSNLNNVMKKIAEEFNINTFENYNKPKNY